MKFPASDKSAVLRVFGVKPTGEMVSGFDQEELAIGVVDLDGKGREREGDLEEEENGEPFVV